MKTEKQEIEIKVREAVENEMIKRIKEADITDDLLLCKKTEVETELYGNFSDRAAYQFVRHIIKTRPQILEELKEKL